VNEWFRAITAGPQLPAEAASRLWDDGFCVVPGPVPADALDPLAGAYDRAMAEADPADRREGRTTIRVHDFVNRGAEFDPLYIHAPLLEACCQVIGRPFKLSAMHGRTVLPGKPAQELHVDYARDALGWTLVGFIFMIDEFRRDNGATCFLPGSHAHSTIQVADDQPVPACGAAGSMIIYNGSAWHGHGANTTGEPRRSVQGTFIRREATLSIDLASRIRSETLDRISPLAKYLLAL
jgi:ectoine hydroxylase-related dioxygenase (phytanoyl-CoA dioxygenase family)